MNSAQTFISMGASFVFVSSTLSAAPLEIPSVKPDYGLPGYSTSRHSSILDDSNYFSALKIILDCRLEELKEKGLIVSFVVKSADDKIEAHVLSASVEAAADIIFALEDAPDLNSDKIELDIV